MNILVIDDDKVDRLTVRDLLRDGFVVLEAQAGEEGLAQVSANQIDCVLLDYLIPGTDSLQLLSNLAAKQIAVVMFTGEGDEKVAVSAMKLGAQDYLNKGHLTTELLTKSITNAVDTVGLKRALATKQEELVGANSELADKVRALERITQDLENLIHIASHDLREPVKNFYSYCDLFEKGVGSNLSAQSKEQLDAMRTNAKKLAVLIDDLRTLTRIVRDREPYEAIDLSEVVKTSLLEFEHDISARNVNVKIDALPQVVACRQLLIHLYRNLISNALKYGPANDMRLSITSERYDQSYIFGVKNNGTFIKPADLIRVFQPLCRLANSTGKDGSGMGLSLCEKIIERHAGRIWVESSPEMGVHVRFILGVPK